MENKNNAMGHKAYCNPKIRILHLLFLFLTCFQASAAPTIDSDASAATSVETISESNTLEETKETDSSVSEATQNTETGLSPSAQVESEPVTSEASDANETTSSAESESTTPAATETTTAPDTTEQSIAVSESVETAKSKESPKQLKKFQVTGTQIKRVDLEGPSPVLVINREDIDRSGASSIARFLQTLSFNTDGFFNDNLSQATTTALGSTGVNLRGLGQDGTLVLLNGRRVANHGFALDATDTFVDLNSIPLGAVERIEVLKDGASAIYGSDALAGVVNIILKKDYDNSEISVEYGRSAEGDADEHRVNFATGISNDTGNITFIFDYFQRQPFLLSDRDFSASAFQDGAYDQNGVGVDHTQFDNQPANGYDPSLWPDLFCNDPVSNFCFGFFDPNPYITAVPKTERIGGMITMSREISANVDLFSEFMANKTVTEYQSAPTALWGDYDGVIFPGTHPAYPVDLIFPTPAPLPPYPDLYLRWRMTDAGPRKDVVETNMHRFVTGLEGSTNNIDWYFDINLNRSTSILNGENYINRLALIDAFNNGLLDPFGTSDPDEMNSVKASINRKGVSELYATQFKINTEIGELQGGAIALAAGVERRWESLTETPDKLTEQGEVIGQGSTTSSGDRYLNSGFAEVSLPVTDNIELQAATRIENYSDFGNTYNPKLAIRYQPASTVVLRASWGTGFRAPSLPELYQAQASTVNLYVDSARCAAAPPLGCSPEPIRVNFSGNDKLKPEESESIYLGAVFEPIQNFNIGIDYWRYELTNVIDADTQFILDNPALYDYRVVRGTPTVAGDPGPILFINDMYTNIGEQETDGVDLSVKYEWKVAAAGSFHIHSMITRVLNFEQKAYPGASTEDRLGTFQYPELRGNLTFGWKRVALAASITMNYIDGYEDRFYGRDWYGPFFLSGDDNRDFHKIDSYKSYDAQISYIGIAGSKLTFGIKNLTDEDPSFSNATNIGYDPAMSNPTGRFYYLRYNVEF